MKHDIKPGIKVAVVDLDHTLVKGSINMLLVKQEARGLTAVKLMGKLVAPSGGSDNDMARKLINAGSVLFAGKSEAELLPRLEPINKQLRGLTFRQMKERIDVHKRAGAQVWLAGPAPQQLVELLARDLGAERACGVRMKADARGKLTAEPIEPIAYTEGKRDLVLAALAEEGIDPGDVCFYSDSTSDLPLLEAVGSPVCTNPAKELREIARQRGWPIEEYSETVG